MKCITTLKKCDIMFFLRLFDILFVSYFCAMSLKIKYMKYCIVATRGACRTIFNFIFYFFFPFIWMDEGKVNIVFYRENNWKRSKINNVTDTSLMYVLNNS